MAKPKGRHVPRPTTLLRPGEVARTKGRTLSSCRIGALPIIDRILQRMRLEEFLRSYLPRADRRCRIAPAIGITLLLKNVLLCREPLYGVGEWAARYAPECSGSLILNCRCSTTTASAGVLIACSAATSRRWSWHW